MLKPQSNSISGEIRVDSRRLCRNIAVKSKTYSSRALHSKWLLIVRVYRSHQDEFSRRSNQSTLIARSKRAAAMIQRFSIVEIIECGQLCHGQNNSSKKRQTAKNVRKELSFSRKFNANSLEKPQHLRIA